MKNKLLQILTAAAFLWLPSTMHAQAPALGMAARFVLFTSNGAVGNTGTSHLTGDVGTNNGAFSGFGNVDGVMQNANGITGTATADLLNAYNQLKATVPTFFPAILLGNGQTLNAGVYSIAGNAALNLILNLDAQNNPNAVFIIKIQGTFSAAAGSKVVLKNGAIACNVFWMVEGVVSLAGSQMVGTIVANNAAINILVGSSLNGRALSTAGAVNITSILAYTPIGCGSPVLTGPAAPALGSLSCYALLTSIGALTNTGVTYIKGDVGTNNGPVSGFNPLFVTGTIHAVPDASTAQGTADISTLYNKMNTTPYDIELLYPAQFGNSLVLTPHTYILKSATTLTDTLFLNAEGNPNAVFEIQIQGALNTSTYSNIVLLNNAKSSNVFWKVEGLVNINDYSIFRGTLLANNGAVNLFIGDTLDGRALSQVGAITTHTVFMTINSGPSTITASGPTSFCQGGSVILTASSGGSYSWSNGATTQSITVTMAGTYSVSIANACGTNPSASVTVTVTPAPLANAGNNAFICAGGSANLGAAPVGTNTYSWVSNPAGFTSIVSNPTVSPLVTTIYTLTESAGAGCSKSNSVTVTINSPPNANAGSNATVCAGNSTTIGAAPVTGNTYSWTSNPVGFTSTLSNPVVSPIATTTYTLTESVGTCSKSNTVTITVNPAPNANAGSNASACAGASVTLGAAAVIGNTYAWTSNPAGFTSTVSNPTVNPLVTTVYTLTETNPSNCSKSNSVIVTISPAPAAIVGPNDTICSSAQRAIGGPNVAGDTYSWTSNPAGFTSALSNPVVSPTVTTTFILKETNPAACSKTDSVKITVKGGSSILAYTGPAQTIELGASVLIGGTAVAGNSYIWTPSTGLNSALISQPLASPTTTTTYTLTEISGSGCGSATGTVVVTVTIDFFNGFSPNGDGINDTWNIPLLFAYPTNQVLIINRWGAEVWKGINYDSKTIAWNGQNMSGQDLPDGTYYYIISYNNQEKRGWVVLKR
jgi:gliding motility-associated-like protein